jgi:hypothetical protein
MYVFTSPINERRFFSSSNIFCTESISLAHHWKKKRNSGVPPPQIKGSILKYRVPPVWLTYRGERRTTFTKAYAFK